MPVLKGALQADGALVNIEVGWSAILAAQLRAALRPVPPAIAAKALLDTGAEVTCLDGVLIQGLALPGAGTVLANVPAAGGLTGGTQHRASLMVVHPSGNPVLNLVVRDLLLVALPLAGLGYEALIGRDILDRCAFLYHGPLGRFRLSY